MDLNRLSPYIRVAMYSTMGPRHHLGRRTIFDYEIICVKGGGSDIIIGDTTYRVKENDIVLLRPGVAHEFCGIGEPFFQPHIHFDPFFDEKSLKRTVSFRDERVMSEEERLLIQNDVLFPDRIPPVFVPRDGEAFRSCFFKIIDIYRKKEKNYTVRYKLELMRLLDMIFRQFNCYGDETKAEDDSVIDAVKEYIDNNSDKLMTLDGLSEQFFLNKYTLMRKFTEKYGVTVIAYYNKRRAEAAKQLLASTRLSVSEVSEALGFADIYTFSRFFKNATGASPTSFRKL